MLIYTAILIIIKMIYIFEVKVMKRKIISVIISMAIILSSICCFSTVAYAANYTSGDLKCTLDTNTGLFTVSGSGYAKDYSSKTLQPWLSNRKKIKNVVIEEGVKSIGKCWFESCTALETIVFNGNTVEKIGEKAFYGCTASTYWLNLPESCTSVGANAFNNTGFNYVSFAAPTISLQTNSFGSTGYARFFGQHNSGAYDFVKSGRANGNNWFYYCINDSHIFVTDIISPSCTSDGYSETYCSYCDYDHMRGYYTDCLGHDYQKMASSGNGFFKSSCSRCGSNDFNVSAIELMAYFENGISHDNDKAPFHQSNYAEKFDTLFDGYINSKDFLFLSKEAAKIDVSNKKTTVNTAVSYQTIDGFGASGCWWSQDLGKRDTDKIDKVTELLYGDTGAGLNIYRYNLGGGSENDWRINDIHRRAEDFLSPTSNINDPSTYDWNADKGAQNVLACAQRANKDLKVTLFSNSPPTVITENGSACCTAVTYDGNGNIIRYPNLSESNYQAFANYVINCAEHFIDEGYNVTELSPINEPEWEWAYGDNGTSSQEGTHWEAADAANFYNNYMIPSLKNSSLNGRINISAWESGQLNHSDWWQPFINTMFSSSQEYSANNALIRETGTLDVHSYWSTTNDRQTVANQLKQPQFSSINKVRCSEYCQMTNDTTTQVFAFYNSADNGGDGKGLSIYYGLALADIMHQDLTILNASEWDWWTACSAGIYTDGLVYFNYDDTDDIFTSKRLWAMGNYARFIDEGAKRIEVTTESGFGSSLHTDKTYTAKDQWGNVVTDKSNYIEQSAYLNPDGSVAVVYINNSDTDEFTTFGSDFATLETYVTDEYRNLEKYQSGSAKNRTVHLPKKSITTVVLK